MFCSAVIKIKASYTEKYEINFRTEAKTQQTYPETSFQTTKRFYTEF